jgi:hypothetical protein
MHLSNLGFTYEFIVVKKGKQAVYPSVLAKICVVYFRTFLIDMGFRNWYHRRPRHWFKYIVYHLMMMKLNAIFSLAFEA